MPRPCRPLLAARLVLALALVGLLASCRVDAVTTARPAETAYPGPLMTRTPRPTKAAPSPAVPATPAPRPSATATAAPTPADVAFRVTILHSGEVRGEVRPCG